jgi:hypothetical protein
MVTRRLSITFAILNLLGFLGTIIVNGLANALPLNNRNTGELSDLYPNLFVPAGLTFSIWGLIYLLLAIFVVYHLVSAFRKTSEMPAFSARIGILFFISCLANIGWIFAWHYEILPLSLFFMLIILACLLAIYLRLDIGKSSAANQEKYMVHLPLSVYLGWITIATIANVTALLVKANWNNFGLGEPFWTMLVIVVGIAIALAVIFTRKDIFYALVVDWAILGILIKRLTVDAVPVQSVVITAIIGLVLITLGILIQIVRRKIY